MEILDSYNLIIEASIILILSFIFGEISRKTNIPSVLMLIVLGIVLKLVLDTMGVSEIDWLPVLKVLGIVGLIMIVLEAALELELKREKYVPIAIALVIALIGLLASAYVAALILNHFVEGMTMQKAWIYATPISILSSAIIIPSVVGLEDSKREFHIYESTFSDILGIMVFYFLTGQLEDVSHGSGGFGEFGLNLVATIFVSFVASYLIVLIFQNIRSHTKLFLLISVLLLLYAVGKKMHLSSLLIILIFGLVIANMPLFFRGPLAKWLNLKQAKSIYDGLHVITMETAFVVRTFFFVVFGLTIALGSLKDWNVAMVSGLIILSIYVIRYILLRLFLGRDILPQLFIAPRGLITILLFYAIPKEALVPGFEAGVLLYIIIGTSLIMTVAMIFDKRRTGKAINKAQHTSIGYEKWKVPTISEVVEDTQKSHH